MNCAGYDPLRYRSKIQRMFDNLPHRKAIPQNGEYPILEKKGPSLYFFKKPAIIR